MPYLITPTLLNQFDWMRNCKPEKKHQAEVDFSNILHRIYPDKISKAILLGRKFEHYITKSVKTGKNGSDKFNQIRDKFLNSKFQQVTKKIINVNGENYLLYGKMDAVQPNKILELKTTSNYRGDNYYLDGWQGRIYPYCTGITNFDYIIVEMTEDEQIDKFITLSCDADIEISELAIRAAINQLTQFFEENKHYEYAFKKIFTRY